MAATISRTSALSEMSAQMIDGYVALAANDLSGRVDPALWRRRSFDRPAVDNRRCQTPRTPFALPVKR